MPLGVVEEVAQHALEQLAVAQNRHRIHPPKCDSPSARPPPPRAPEGRSPRRPGRRPRHRAGSPAGCRRSGRRARRCRREAAVSRRALRRLRADSMARRMRDSGVRSSCEVLASSSLCAPDQLLDAGGGAVEARGQPRDLVIAFDRARGRERSPAPSSSTPSLQPLEAAGQAAHHRVGAHRDRERDAAQEEDQPNTGWRRRSAAGRPASGRPASCMAHDRHRPAVDPAGLAGGRPGTGRPAAATGGEPRRTSPRSSRAGRAGGRWPPAARRRGTPAAATAPPSARRRSRSAWTGRSLGPSRQDARDQHDQQQARDDREIELVIKMPHRRISPAPWRTRSRRRAR